MFYQTFGGRFLSAWSISPVFFEFFSGQDQFRGVRTLLITIVVVGADLVDIQ